MIHKFAIARIGGTVTFHAKFSRMRKEQDFIVYPLSDAGTQITVQSSTRFGTICLDTGKVRMSKPHASGAYGIHLATDRLIEDTLPEEERQALRDWVKKSGGTQVGEILITDNTGAIAL